MYFCICIKTILLKHKNDFEKTQSLIFLKVVFIKIFLVCWSAHEITIFFYRKKRKIFFVKIVFDNRLRNGLIAWLNAHQSQ